MLDVRILLGQLRITEAEADVYLMMLKGVQSAREITSATARSRPTVYYALSALERRGLIVKLGNSEEYRYQVEPLSRLKTMLQEQEDAIATAKTQLDEFITMHQQRSPGDNRPHVAYYEGVQAVKNIIMESLYCRNRKIDSLVSSDNFFWQLGEDFVEHYAELRHTLGISSRNLWGKAVSREGVNKDHQKALIRLLPDSMGDRLRTTIFIYDDVVLYVSLLSGGYALAVHSAEHSEMMRAFYEVFWGLGKSLEI